MSVNNLSDEELLQLAQETRKLNKRDYDYADTSVNNYIRMHRFQHTMNDNKIYRVPFTLMYMHYVDWMKTNYPQLVIQNCKLFIREVKSGFNVLTVKNLHYALIKNHLMFRKYDHKYNNTVYKAVMRRTWKQQKRNYIESLKKESYKKSRWSKKP